MELTNSNRDNSAILKILFPIGSFYPAQLGGPSNTIYWLAKALKKEEIQVSVITTDAGINKTIELNTWHHTNYGNVIYIKTRIITFPLRHILLSIKFLFRHNIIHLNSLFYAPSTIIGIIGGIINKSVIWSVRGELSTSALNNGQFKKRLIIKLIKLFKSKFSFHSTSDAETAAIRLNIGPQVKIIQIPNYMEIPKVYPRKCSDIPYLFYLGRIHQIKALENLIEALSLSRTFKKNMFQMRLAGDYQNEYGEYLKDLCEKLNISKRVFFIGRTEGIAKDKLLANAHALVLPSHSENFGNVVLESLAQGTPVIASKGTPWEILEKHRAGFWSNNRPIVLAKAIDAIFEMEEMRYLKYRENAYKLVKTEFNISEKIGEWKNEYNILSK